MYLQIFEINEISSGFNEITKSMDFCDFEISYRILGSVGPLAYNYSYNAASDRPRTFYSEASICI